MSKPWSLHDLPPKIRAQAEAQLEPKVAETLRGRRNKHTEADFQKSVIQFAQLHGWRVAHFQPVQTVTGHWIKGVKMRESLSLTKKIC